MDSETFQIANLYGLGHLQSLLKAGILSELEQSLFDAIAWFGDATKDTSSIHAFVKFYISMEVAAKGRNEQAGGFLPDRISTLIDPHDRARQNRLKKSVEKIIRERNAIFHAGKPENDSIDYLEYVCRRIARNTIHHLRELIRTNDIKTKDALAAWVSEQQKRVDTSG